MKRPYQTKPSGRHCDCGEHVFARTSRWGIVLVSPKDANLLFNFVWTLLEPKKGYFYARSMRLVSAENKAGTIHRCIIPEATMVDHANGNGLDCRDQNIRSASRGRSGTEYHLGYFDDPHIAAAAVKAKLKELFGEFAPHA